MINTSRSATTSNSRSSAPTQIINVDDDNNNGTDSSTFLTIWAGPPPTRSHKTSPIWGYLPHLDLAFHPEMKLKRVCLICHEDGRDKVISVGKDYSPAPLVQHLRTHPEKFQEYLEKNEKL